MLSSDDVAVKDFLSENRFLEKIEQKESYNLPRHNEPHTSTKTVIPMRYDRSDHDIGQQAIQSIDLAAVDTSNNSGALPIIIGGSVGGVLLVVLIVVTIYCLRKRKRHKEDVVVFKGDIFSKLSSSVPPSRPGGFVDLPRGDGTSVSADHSPVDPTINATFEFKLPQPRAQRYFKMSPDTVGNVDPQHYMTDFSGDILHQLGKTCLGFLEVAMVLEEGSEDNLVVSVLRVSDLRHCRTSAWALEKHSIFVKVYLLPDEIAHETKMVKTSLSPVYNECFLFKLPTVDRSSRILLFSVYDLDRRHVRHSLGHVKIRMEDVVLEEETYHRLPLAHRAKCLNNRMGEMDISLTYNPDKHKIKIEILHCLYLSDYSPGNEDSGLFVRTTLLYGRRVHKSKDTTMRPLSSSPNFSETLVFTISRQNLETAHISVQVMRIPHKSDPDSGVVSLGRLELGPCLYSRGNQNLHWQRVLDQPRTTVRMRHTLETPEEDVRE